jgi:protocatechuate 4,5-dioxygenase beta chain
MDQLSGDPEAADALHDPGLVELAGAQGVEFLNWMAMRGALTGTVSELHRNYHIPISNTAAATLLLEKPPARATQGGVSGAPNPARSRRSRYRTRSRCR